MQNLHEVDLAPVLPLQFLRRDVERVAVGILGRRDQRRVSEVWRLGVEIGRTRERSVEEGLGIDVCVAKFADHTIGRLEKALRHSQRGDLGIDRALL